MFLHVIKTLLILGKGEYATFYAKYCAMEYPELELVFASHEDADFSSFVGNHINMTLGRELETITSYFEERGTKPLSST